MITNIGKQLTGWGRTLSILFFSYLMIRISLPYLSFRPDVDFLLTKQKIIHLKVWRYAFYTHVITSSFVLLAGAIQFSKVLLKRAPRWHRWIGKLYVGIIVLLSGPSGLIMALYANGDERSKTSFVLLSCLWIVFTALAFYLALRQKFEAHRQFMIRSYALTLSAISLRTLAYFLPNFIHLPAKDAYALISWLSWTLNLLIAELILYFVSDRKMACSAEKTAAQRSRE